MGPLYHSSRSPTRFRDHSGRGVEKTVSTRGQKGLGRKSISRTWQDAALIHSLWLWLPAQDLPKIKPSNIPAWMERASWALTPNSGTIGGWRVLGRGELGFYWECDCWCICWPWFHGWPHIPESVGSTSWTWWTVYKKGNEYGVIQEEPGSSERWI